MAIRNTLTLGVFTLPGRESGAPSREVRQTSASLAGNCLNRVFWGVKDALASCPVATGRDVPIGAVRGLASRNIRTRITRAAR